MIIACLAKFIRENTSGQRKHPQQNCKAQFSTGVFLLLSWLFRSFLGRISLFLAIANHVHVGKASLAHLHCGCVAAIPLAQFFQNSVKAVPRKYVAQLLSPFLCFLLVVSLFFHLYLVKSRYVCCFSNRQEAVYWIKCSHHLLGGKKSSSQPFIRDLV